jgi:hypothetical protein
LVLSKTHSAKRFHDRSNHCLTMTKHATHFFGATRLHRVDHALDHGNAGDGMQDFGQGGLHPGAFSGSQNDH